MTEQRTISRADCEPELYAKLVKDNGYLGPFPVVEFIPVLGAHLPEDAYVFFNRARLDNHTANPRTYPLYGITSRAGIYLSEYQIRNMAEGGCRYFQVVNNSRQRFLAAAATDPERDEDD